MAVITDTDLIDSKLSMLDSERNWAILIHLSLYSFFVLSIFGFFVPFVLWLWKKNESKFIDSHGKAALNFALTLTLLAVAVVLVVILFAFGTLVTLIGDTSPLTAGQATPYVFLFIAFWLVVGALIIFMPIFGVRAALHGKTYHYPIAFSFFK